MSNLIPNCLPTVLQNIVFDYMSEPDLHVWAELPNYKAAMTDRINLRAYEVFNGIAGLERYQRHFNYHVQTQNWQLTKQFLSFFKSIYKSGITTNTENTALLNAIAEQGSSVLYNTMRGGLTFAEQTRYLIRAYHHNQRDFFCHELKKYPVFDSSTSPWTDDLNYINHAELKLGCTHLQHLFTTALFRRDLEVMLLLKEINMPLLFSSSFESALFMTLQSPLTTFFKSFSEGDIDLLSPAILTYFQNQLSNTKPTNILVFFRGISRNQIDQFPPQVLESLQKQYKASCYNCLYSFLKTISQEEFNKFPPVVVEHLQGFFNMALLTNDFETVDLMLDKQLAGILIYFDSQNAASIPCLTIKDYPLAIVAKAGKLNMVKTLLSLFLLRLEGTIMGRDFLLTCTEHTVTVASRHSLISHGLTDADPVKQEINRALSAAFSAAVAANHLHCALCIIQWGQAHSCKVSANSGVTRAIFDLPASPEVNHILRIFGMLPQTKTSSTPRKK